MLDIPIDDNSQNDPVENNYKEDLLNSLETMSKVSLPYKHYRQVTPIGCGVASFLMGLSGLNEEYTPSSEDEIYRTKKLRKISGAVPTFELMRLVDNNNLKMDIYFENSTSDFDENSTLIRNYNKTVQYMKNKGVLKRYVDRAKITPALIKEQIAQGRYVLINGMVSGVPHMRVGIGYDDDNLIIADPLLNKTQEYTNEDFNQNCSPPFGKRFISLYK